MRLIGRWIGWSLAVLIAAFLLLQLWYLGWVLWWNWQNPVSTSFMRIQAESLQQASGRPVALKYRWVDYSQISNHLKRAVIVAEDDTFVDHDGVNWESLEKAYWNNQRKGKKIKGGSTITQQLAKNLFLTGERSYWRKGQELLITWMLEAVMSKRRILELYLNVAEWGEGVFGAQAGALHHYGIPAAQLSSQQAARMAAMLPRPRYYDKRRDAPYLQQYSSRILGRMPHAELP
nr:monofunctional biosynthetic peptidoglycan transglycosylase [Parvibium lacunae]